MTPGNRGGGENILITRFMASNLFKAVYKEKLQKLYKEAFLDGVLTETVARYSTLVHSVMRNATL